MEELDFETYALNDLLDYFTRNRPQIKTIGHISKLIKEKKLQVYLEVNSEITLITPENQDRVNEEPNFDKRQELRNKLGLKVKDDILEIIELKLVYLSRKDYEVTKVKYGGDIYLITKDEKKVDLDLSSNGITWVDLEQAGVKRARKKSKNIFVSKENLQKFLSQNKTEVRQPIEDLPKSIQEEPQWEKARKINKEPGLFLSFALETYWHSTDADGYKRANIPEFQNSEGGYYPIQKCMMDSEKFIL